jgi:aryl-alcohol dehydrogenase-like predicted oxidoreductase
LSGDEIAAARGTDWYRVLMKTRVLGRTDLPVSVVAFGNMTFGDVTCEDDARAIYAAARGAGINFFDTAEIYAGGRSEEILGQLMKGEREAIVVATKVRGPFGHEGSDRYALTRQTIVAACERSLKRLETDYIDLYQVHWPDLATPEEETLRGLDDLVRSGKVRYVGVSNYTPSRLHDAADVSARHDLPRYQTNQPIYNAVDPDVDDALPKACAAEDVSLIPYSPLAGGFLTGKYPRGSAPPDGTRGATSDGWEGARWKARLSDRGWKILEAMQSIAAAHGAPVGAVAVAWVLAQPAVASAIIGATRPAHIRDAALAAEWELTPDELRQIATARENA